MHWASLWARELPELKGVGYRRSVRLVFIVCSILLGACASRGASDEPAPPPRPVSAPPEAKEEVVPPAEQRLDLRSLGPQRFVTPSFRITSPRRAERVELGSAAETKVVVEGAEPSMQVALDGHAFRPLQGGQVTLGRLVLEDEEIAPGPHRLVVLGESGAGTAVAATWFWVHDPGDSGRFAPEQAPPPGIVLASPQGTYHGEEAADAVHVEAFALNEKALDQEGTASPARDDVPVLIRLAGPGGPVQRETRGESLGVVHLESGDYRVEAHLALGGTPGAPPRGPWGSVVRTITVNRDSAPGGLR